MDTREQTTWPKVMWKKGEAYLPKNMVPSFCSGRQSLVLWGCIAHGKKGPLIPLELLPKVVTKTRCSHGRGLTSEAYAKQVIKSLLNQFLNSLEVEQGHKILIVEDGAASHRGPEAQQNWAELGIEQLTHLANSPDLNLIGPIWRLLKSCVFKIPGAHKNRDTLLKAANKVWASISVDNINKHTGDTDAWVEAIKAAKGGPTEF
ncbi:DDE superfamily endonuclease [Rhizoctonia solani]|uniref:DDE superfamily endonuclease n=1 Tax=Rhizoctonia solani TaxID=456999 RepID=A0A8H8P6I8_9AGAM|nr:DDE superfamily endonuclease [Rhizoctonia solani]XP_043186407.1 DDE superfamily endonuclease [Rhizoctonia solani]QRW17486.1 DDE superfamily endonuclease [Rhizoctonia solani]QRW26170.1 DDE superfamily endonuclease [Rhizoctonia solani]